MQTTNTNYTVAEYCDQLERKQIVINRDYQRSERVWPTAARSFLIDTILNGYPVPKISLSQKTILNERKTIKEVVDGQQRSMAIFDFFNDRYALNKGVFSGLRYSTLEPEQQADFMQYNLSADIFSGANDADIREVFRRINSYTIPLNNQEYRHAVYQGPFKWFISNLCKTYGQFLRNIGTFNERQLSRMLDAELFTEFCEVNIVGIKSASQKSLDEIYKKRDERFIEEEEFSKRIDEFMGFLADIPEIHNTPMTKRYMIYSLYAAFCGIKYGIPGHQVDETLSQGAKIAGRHEVAAGLLLLSSELSEGIPFRFPEFYFACSKGTNRIGQRLSQADWLSKAISGNLSNFI